MAEGLHTSCPTHGLAESPVGSVTLCPGCGVIHVTLNYVTVRLEPGAFDELTRMLMQARLALVRERVKCDEARAEIADVTRDAGNAIH